MSSPRRFLDLLEELLEAAPGSLNENQRLDEVGWDSLALVGFLAAADEEYGCAVAPREIRACKTLGELRRLVESSAPASATASV
jgi:acyl carrier protein